MGKKGKQAVHKYFSDDRMADDTLAVFEQYLSAFEKDKMSAKTDSH